MTVVKQILSRLENINKPQHKFLQVLFATRLTVHSAINFLSLGRHSELSERTFRRQFRRDFDFPAFNRETIRQANCPPPLAPPAPGESVLLLAAWWAVATRRFATVGSARCHPPGPPCLRLDFQ